MGGTKSGSIYCLPSLLRIVSSPNPLFYQKARGPSYKQNLGLGSPGFPRMTPTDRALPYCEWVGAVSRGLWGCLPWKADYGSENLSLTRLSQVICPLCTLGSRHSLRFGISCQCSSRDRHGFSISCACLQEDWRLNFRLPGPAQKQ